MTNKVIGFPKRLGIFFCSLVFTGTMLAQTAAIRPVTASIDTADLRFLNWYNASPDSLDMEGALMDKAYRDLLSGRQGKTVIVAVIDGGVDIQHEDLKEHIWTNENEIPGNGIDDDRNGYVDDIHGWNFLVNEKGESITYDTYELTRIVRDYNTKYGYATNTDVAKPDPAYLKMVETARKEYDDKLGKYKAEKEKIDIVYKGYVTALANMKDFTGKENPTLNDIRQSNPMQDMVRKSRNYLLYLDQIGYSLQDLEAIKENNYNHLFFHLNLEYNPRGHSANAASPENYGYGNNNVTGEKPGHGTFVSGIIAAGRNNHTGINGIADHALIMPVLAVPDGDERDRDVAGAIRYAVRNGARVINCSFGKSYSPEKSLVDEAISEAVKKDVLIVHSAGNEAENTDTKTQYPSPKLENGTEFSGHWLTVGASTSKAGKSLAGKFSNYGRQTVDLFAPGVNILSLKPGDAYETGSGTSFAAPVVSGIAAMLFSYFPELTATQVKKIIMDSVTSHRKLRVFMPSEKNRQKKKTRFGNLSATGGVVNAYDAVKMALELQK